jgi:hypothetical protein
LWPSAQVPIGWRLFSDLIGGIMSMPGPQKITFGEMADSGAWRDTRGHSLMMSIGSDSGIASSRPRKWVAGTARYSMLLFLLTPWMLFNIFTSSLLPGAPLGNILEHWF